MQVPASQTGGAPGDDERTDDCTRTGGRHGKVRDVQRHSVLISSGIRVRDIAQHVAGTVPCPATMPLRGGVQCLVAHDIGDAGAGEDEGDSVRHRPVSLDGHLRGASSVDHVTRTRGRTMEVAGGGDIGGDEVAHVHRDVAQ